VSLAWANAPLDMVIVIANKSNCLFIDGSGLVKKVHSKLLFDITLKYEAIFL
jgi:hypothetical protein